MTARGHGLRITLVALLGGLLGADWPMEADPAPWSQTSLGVEVQDIKVGSGEEVVSRSQIEVHYVGMLKDGTVFDASRPRGTTFSFRVGNGQVIPGWDDGLLGMRVGGVRRLVIPPEQAYGDRAQGNIPSSSTLYFEVELMSVQPPRLPPTTLATVADDAWLKLPDARAADVVVGSGAKVKLRKGQRACLDYAVFDGEGALVEHTFNRNGCTWYELRDEDLPEKLEAGLRGMREGGTRVVEGKDGHHWQVSLQHHWQIGRWQVGFRWATRARRADRLVEARSPDACP